MLWSEMYGPQNQPTAEEISRFIDNGLWVPFCNQLENRYQVKPHYTYSKCSGQPGWNIKYQKSGKALCTLYPELGHFTALVVAADKRQTEFEAALPLLTPYVRGLYENTKSLMGGRWLMIHVTDDNIYRDVLELISIRMKK